MSGWARGAGTKRKIRKGQCAVVTLIGPHAALAYSCIASTNAERGRNPYWTWRARLGSNQQPLPSEGSTLSIELRAHIGTERTEREAPQDSAFGRKRPSQTRERHGTRRAAATFRWVFDAGRKAAPRAVPRVKGPSIADIIARYLPKERRGQVCLGRRGDSIAMVFLPSSRSNAAPTHCRRCS